MHFYVFWGSWKRNCLAAHSQSPCDARSLNQFMGLLMKRLAGLVEPSGGSGQSDSFWVFWNSGLNLIGAKVSGDSYGLLMMANGGEILEKCPDGTHRLAARALAARRQRSGSAAECCNAML
ncbi:hypothetical protein DEO72_LG3g1011 [Vigna unguiculata]|uniref:Uncharacterized protein n=1 Tax=Vigna unguiculata TaxID=3917 RepID=A0A4D6LD88_VIGUN|nr:hypothetical protein DEO72_LG3g1011 [Vigna unguiculata]